MSRRKYTPKQRQRAANNVTRALQVRSVHRELAQLVEHEGTEAPRRLFEVYRQHNAKHFAGKLGEPFVMLMTPSSPRALGDYQGKDPHGIYSRIRVRPNVLKKGAKFTDDVLLHEMVHAWCNEIVGDPEEGYKGHGPEFARKCNAIGETLGLAKVFARGRGGPNCAQWPMNVRPADYYDDAPTKQGAEGEEEGDDESKNSKTKEPESFAAAILRTVERYTKKHPEMTLDDIAQALAELGATMASNQTHDKEPDQ